MLLPMINPGQTLFLSSRRLNLYSYDLGKSIVFRQSLKHRARISNPKSLELRLLDSWFLRLCNEKEEKVLKTMHLQLLRSLRKFVLN